MTIRSYYNESGDTWVCIMNDDRSAFVARRALGDTMWELSARQWVSNGDGTQKLHIITLGKFATVEQAQQTVGVNIEKKTISLPMAPRRKRKKGEKKTKQFLLPHIQSQ